jgi:hypothetical protein
VLYILFLLFKMSNQYTSHMSNEDVAFTPHPEDNPYVPIRALGYAPLSSRHQANILAFPHNPWQGVVYSRADYYGQVHNTGYGSRASQMPANVRK